MSWWQRLLSSRQHGEFPIEPAQLAVGADWKLVRQEPVAAYWRDTSGDVLSLTLARVDRAFPVLSDAKGLQAYCRRVAESQSAGLVEVASIVGAEGPGVVYIYKRLQIPAFTFFGVAATPIPSGIWIWMIIASERGPTGVREALVTSKLFEAGQLTLESYEASWAQDPYEPSYHSVDRSTLRYLSDAAEYDANFPNHPLTKVRRELGRLVSIRLSPGTAA